ncbi:MAG TPA: hypothetical protein VFA26_10170 [Gemmataceae bacterium]|nr:hypothetical protein [Gemmataceae bacterium]
MARRHEALALAATLAAGLLSGCLTRPPQCCDPPAGWRGPPPPDPRSLGSPYQQGAGAPVPPRDGDIKQVAYPKPALELPQHPPEGDRPPPPPDVPPRVEPTPLPQPTPAPADEPIIKALRCLLEKRPAEAVEALKGYDPANQEVLLGVLPWLVRLTETNLDRASPQESAALLEQLDRLEERLRERSPLAIDKMCLCREVKRFGDYQPLPEGHAFQAGVGGGWGEPVCLYVELRNFSSRPHGPLYETRLAGRVDLRDEKGQRVWVYDFPVEVDRSRTPRRDRFVRFEFQVPPKVPPGRYSLHLEIRDVTGQASSRDAPPHRTARAALELRVIANQAVRGGRGGDPGAAARGGGGG